MEGRHVFIEELESEVGIEEEDGKRGAKTHKRNWDGADRCWGGRQRNSIGRNAREDG